MSVSPGDLLPVVCQPSVALRCSAVGGSAGVSPVACQSASSVSFAVDQPAAGCQQHDAMLTQSPANARQLPCSAECLLCSVVLAALACSKTSCLLVPSVQGHVLLILQFRRCRCSERRELRYLRLFAAGRFASLCVGVHGPPACSKCDSRRVCVAQRASCSDQQCSVALRSVLSRTVLVLAHVHESQTEEVLCIWRRHSQTTSVRRGIPHTHTARRSPGGRSPHG